MRGSLAKPPCALFGDVEIKVIQEVGLGMLYAERLECVIKTFVECGKLRRRLKVVNRCDPRALARPEVVGPAGCEENRLRGREDGLDFLENGPACFIGTEPM